MLCIYLHIHGLLCVSMCMIYNPVKILFYLIFQGEGEKLFQGAVVAVKGSRSSMLYLTGMSKHMWNRSEQDLHREDVTVLLDYASCFVWSWVRRQA